MCHLAVSCDLSAPYARIIFLMKHMKPGKFRTKVIGLI